MIFLVILYTAGILFLAWEFKNAPLIKDEDDIDFTDPKNYN